eukprot:gene664-1070_t
MMTRVFVLVAALAVAGTMLASLTEAKGALYQSMVASGCELEDGKGGRVCYNNILYLNWCLVEAGPVPCVENSDQPFQQEEYANYAPYGEAESAASQTSCESLSSSGLKFQHNNQPGFESICGASKIPDPELGSHDEVDGDHKPLGRCPAAVTFAEADSLCKEVGARLCSAEELDNDVATGSGCGLDSKSNFCWAADSCVTNCAHNDDPDSQPACPVDPRTIASVRCCADDDKRGEARLANQCKSAVCGASCAALPGCGWSSARQRCVEGGSTNKQEMSQGDCDGVERVETGGDPDDPCSQFDCGITCKYADSGVEGVSCGWSTNKNRCVLGAKTNKDENFLGPGCPITPAATMTEKQRCLSYTCGATCAQDPACGWSSAKNKCKLGGKVGKLELRAGTDCPDDIETNMPSNDDPCSSYLCGAACAEHANHPELPCGWSKGWGMCREGYQTSPQDLNRCVAGVTLPPTTATTTKKTTASTTSTVWGNRKFCNKAAWYTQCKNLGAPCKWFGRMKSEGGQFRMESICASSHSSSKNCNNDENCDWDDASGTCGLVDTGCVDLKGPGGTVFVDKDGDSCQAYTEKEYCNADGSYGVRWGVDKTFIDYAIDGKSAGHACCKCGGGRPRCGSNTKKGQCVLVQTYFSHCKWKWSDRSCFARDQFNFNN